MPTPTHPPTRLQRAGPVPRGVIATPEDAALLRSLDADGDGALTPSQLEEAVAAFSAGCVTAAGDPRA